MLLDPPPCMAFFVGFLLCRPKDPTAAYMYHESSIKLLVKYIYFPLRFVRRPKNKWSYKFPPLTVNTFRMWKRITILEKEGKTIRKVCKYNFFGNVSSDKTLLQSCCYKTNWDFQPASANKCDKFNLDFGQFCPTQKTKPKNQRHRERSRQKRRKSKVRWS